MVVAPQPGPAYAQQRVRFAEPPAAGPLLARAALGALPGPSRPGDLPGVELELAPRPVDRAHLAAYSRVCGFPVSDRLPVTYPHVLGFPLALALMTRRDFPFPAMGLVHIENRIVQRRALLAHEPLRLRVRATGLGEHPRGRTVTLFTEALVDSESVWWETSVYLRREGGGGRRRGSADRPDRGGDPDRAEPTAVLRFGAEVGRRYAAVSGDVNPIHLNRLAARALGFPRTIAHGLYTAARCLATLGPRLPDTAAVDIRFGRPVLLPATVSVFARPATSASPDSASPTSPDPASPDSGSGWDIEATGPRGSVHLTGQVRPLRHRPV